MGVGSRRYIESLIEAGRITVNGQPAVLGQKVSSSNRVLVDGRPARLSSGEDSVQVLAYHKPAGEIVSRDDPAGRPTVFERLPRVRNGRWIAIGRLDFNTSGLLLLTTSGELASRLMHPSGGIEREYAVRVRGELTEDQIARLLGGVALDDGLARFESIEPQGGRGSNRWYHAVLKEGRNREVRRMLGAVCLTVSRLIRIRFGSHALSPRLRQGQFQLLDAQEVRELEEAMDTPGAPIAMPSTSQRPAGQPKAAGRRRQRS